jgi:ADP-ribosylglycohydrolase
MKEFKYDDAYFQRTYAGWLGKIIGVRMGSPIEGWLNSEIEAKYGEIDRYVQDYNDYAADDDINGPLFFIRSLIDFKEKMDDISVEDMAETWLNYVCDGHGFFWWGGYGISTENTAYDNLKYGIRAPDNASIERNGSTCAEQIGGQIFIDTWGFVFPGNPIKAANFAKKMIAVSHDGEALYGGMFITACISSAYISKDVFDVIDLGLSVIPENCEYANLVKDIIRYYESDLEKNWRNGFRYIQDNYGYDKFPGNCHIMPNAAIIILSLIYGNGDFSYSQMICNTCGWDTDCNSGNLGSILGILNGIKGIDEYWITPIKDVIISSSCIGSLNIDTISNSAQRFASLGCYFAKKDVPKKWKENTIEDCLYLHFDMPNSIQGFRVDDDTIIKNSTHEILQNHRTLLLESLNSNIIDTYIKTYYCPEDLEDSRYDPSFSPIVYPGQSIEFMIENANENPVNAEIYFVDLLSKKRIVITQMTDINPGTCVFKGVIKNYTEALVSRIGIRIIGKSSTNTNKIFVNYLKISDYPTYEIDFKNYKIENYGFSNGKLHTEVQGCSYSKGLWDLENNVLSGSCTDSGELLFGYYPSKNFIYEVSIKPQLGFKHLINFRVQGLSRSYLFGFTGEERVSLIKKHIENNVILSNKYQYKKNKWYRLKVVVKDNIFKCYINDELIFDYQDANNHYSFGQQGFTVMESSRCAYKDVKITAI